MHTLNPNHQRTPVVLNSLIWLLVVALYFPSFWKLYRVRWDLLDYTHAFFILPVSIGLVWLKRKEIKPYISVTLQDTNYSGLFLLFFGITIFIFGSRFDYASVTAFSLIPLLFGMSIFLYGTKMAKMLSFPILYLLLLVPPPMGIIDSLTLPMRYGISNLAEQLLSIMNYPITRDGLLLTIGYTDIFMGQPCSGFRSLITLFSLGLVYVYLSKANLSSKLILILCVIPLALFGNLIRVIILCLITFYFGEEVGQGFFHNFSGIVMFVITILGLILIESLLNRYHSVSN